MSIDFKNKDNDRVCISGLINRRLRRMMWSYYFFLSLVKVLTI